MSYSWLWLLVQRRCRCGQIGLPLVNILLTNWLHFSYHFLMCSQDYSIRVQNVHKISGLE